MPEPLASQSITGQSKSPAPARRMRFDDRQLAEATSTWESLEPPAIDDRSANELARQTEGDFEHRLLARARLLPIASSLTDAMRHVRAATSVMVILALAGALAGGVAAARALLGSPRDEPVNIFHVMAATLGPQTLLLLAWIAVMIFARSSAPLMSIASLGGLVVRGGQWLARRIHPGRPYAAAVAGMSRTLFRGALGRWTFSAVSHALWLAFNVGCIAMLMFLLSTRQYTFAWETTILSAGSYESITHAIGALPKALGFGAPDAAQVAASRWDGASPVRPDAGASQAWSALLIGSLIVYGFAPRLLLVALSLGERRLARSRYRLDIDRPDFARLRGVLEPDTASLGVIDPAAPAESGAASAGAPMPSAPSRPPGLPAILGFELPPTAAKDNWPPRLHGVRWHDMGMIDTREDRRRVIDELSRSTTEPSALLIACGLTTTPDRGVGAFLRDARATISRPPLLILTGGQRLRERGQKPSDTRDSAGRDSSFDERLADWRAIAALGGIPPERIIDVDLDHLTHTTQATLTAMIAGRDTASAAHQRRFEQALDLIAEHVRKQSQQDRAAPRITPEKTAAEHAALHRDIARLYGEQTTLDWRRLLRLPHIDAQALLPQNLPTTLSAGAKRFADLLPERLKRSPKWLAAGATAGALGCVAAAAVISPVALTALPVWSGVGAAIAAVAQPSPRPRKPTESQSQAFNAALAEAVRSAALFAMLLELQGFDEQVITRVLDEVVVDDHEDGSPETDGALADPVGVRGWLDDLRHRFDVALAKESRR